MSGGPSHTPTMETQPETTPVHGDPPCKPPSEAPLFFASDDHGPILLVLMTGAGTCPPAGWGSLPRVLWGTPGPGGGLTDSHPMDTCGLCSQLLGPRDVEGLRGSCRGWAREPPESGGRKELGWEVGAEVLAWPQPNVPPLHLQLSSADDPSIEEATPQPQFYISGSLQVVVHQPKVIGLCFGIFFLSFQIFFKQSIFLGAITQKGPVGCVCVLNP